MNKALFMIVNVNGILPMPMLKLYGIKIIYIFIQKIHLRKKKFKNITADIDLSQRVETKTHSCVRFTSHILYLFIC